MALKNLLKKENDKLNIEVTQRENYCVEVRATSVENLYHLLVENFWGYGFNYFELFVDKEKKIIHIFDSLKNGTSMINRVDPYLFKELCKVLRVEEYRSVKMAIYYPEPGRDYISITVYSSQNGDFGFGGRIDDEDIYSCFKTFNKR